MSIAAVFDRTLFYNPASNFCVVRLKTADPMIPEEARSPYKFSDHLIRFVAVGYDLPRTDSVKMELEGRWTNGKHGCQLEVDSWQEMIPQTRDRICVTYGFRIKESPKYYVYCPQLWCRPDAPLLERLHILKTFREQLAADQGRVVQSTECVLDRRCRPTEIKENYVTADLSHPLMVWLRRN